VMSLFSGSTMTAFLREYQFNCLLGEGWDECRKCKVDEEGDYHQLPVQMLYYLLLQTIL
jgi:hypothetical protein